MMAAAPGYISVKEYAERRGVSLQAVYKQIRAGRLEYTEVTEAGRAVKYIKADQGAPVSNSDTQPGATAPAGEDPAQLAGDPLRVALDLLGAQLQEKDRQIERLQAEIKEKDTHIREQAEKLTELLRNSQQLQAHAQHLLEPHEDPQPEPGAVIEAQEPEPGEESEEHHKKRRGFWAWLFGE